MQHNISLFGAVIMRTKIIFKFIYYWYWFVIGVNYSIFFTQASHFTNIGFVTITAKQEANFMHFFQLWVTRTSTGGYLSDVRYITVINMAFGTHWKSYTYNYIIDNHRHNWPIDCSIYFKLTIPCVAFSSKLTSRNTALNT